MTGSETLAALCPLLQLPEQGPPAVDVRVAGRTLPQPEQDIFDARYEVGIPGGIARRSAAAMIDVINTDVGERLLDIDMTVRNPDWVDAHTSRCSYMQRRLAKAYHGAIVIGAIERDAVDIPETIHALDAQALVMSAVLEWTLPTIYFADDPSLFIHPADVASWRATYSSFTLSSVRQVVSALKRGTLHIPQVFDWAVQHGTPTINSKNWRSVLMQAVPEPCQHNRSHD